MTQSVLESMARAMWEQNSILCGRAGGLNPWEREIGGMCEVWEILARAALIALRDGVTPGMMLAGMAAEAPGSICMGDILSYDNKAEPELEASFLAMLNHVLQEGEKDTESAE